MAQQFDSIKLLDFMEAEFEDSTFFLVMVLFFTVMPILTLLVTWLIGRTIEKNHYRNIKKREEAWIKIPAVNGKDISSLPPIVSSELVVGSVVVSVDRFKRWLAGFRKIFGGEMRSYSSVIDRGRREAILRMKEACPNADMFLNCRIMTSTISNNRGKSDLGCSEVMAYATAVRFEDKNE